MEWQGLFVGKHPEVYEPSDDTFLLAEAVAEEMQARVPGTRFLEVGCGAGLIAMVAARAGAKVTCTDINPAAVALAKANARKNDLEMEVVETDLLEGLQGPFDMIAFNPPYLPTGPDDVVQGPLNLAFDGGIDGNAVVMRFAEQVRWLEPLPQTVLVVRSSLSDPTSLAQALDAVGYHSGVAKNGRYFYEELTVHRFIRE